MPVPDEVVLLEEPGVRVTTAKVVLGATTYPIAGITSLRVDREVDSGGGCGFVLVFGGIVMALFGAVSLLPVAFPDAQHPIDPAAGKLLAVVGATLLLSGIALAGVILRSGSAPPRFTLWIGTAGGDRKGLTLRDRDRLGLIQAAVEDAIARRG